MSGNKNSGRKQNKLQSFEVRFQMQGQYKERLKKRADNFGVNGNQYIKWLVQQDLEK